MKKTKTYNFGWIFSIAAVLVLIFQYEIVWWQAILVILLASFEFTITRSRTYSRPITNIARQHQKHLRYYR